MKWTNKGHQYDAYQEIFSNKPNIYLYGAGENCEYVYSLLAFTGSVKGVIDKDFEDKQQICGLPVLSPDCLPTVKNDSIIIVTVKESSAIAKGTIMKKCFLSGLVQGVDFFYYKDFIIDNNNLLLALWWLFAHKKLFLKTACSILSTICNLKCKGCLVFCDVARERKIARHRDLYVLKTVLDNIFRWVDYTPWFGLSGGETLLYPHLCEYLEYFGSHYRDRVGDDFQVDINGTIVPSDELCGILKKYDMMVVLSDYTDSVPSSIETRKVIINKLKAYGIRFLDNSVKKWFDLYGGEFIVKNPEMTDEQYSSRFDQCKYSSIFNCTLKDKLYACCYSGFAAMSDFINETQQFDLSVPISQDSRIELFEFIQGFNEQGFSDFCRLCFGHGDTVNDKRITVANQEGRDK